TCSHKERDVLRVLSRAGKRFTLRGDEPLPRLSPSRPRARARPARGRAARERRAPLRARATLPAVLDRGVRAARVGRDGADRRPRPAPRCRVRAPRHRAAGERGPAALASPEHVELSRRFAGGTHLTSTIFLVSTVLPVTRRYMYTPLARTRPSNFTSCRPVNRYSFSSKFATSRPATS